MRKQILILILIIVPFSVFAQLSLSKITEGEKTYTKVPRFSMDYGIPINISGPYAVLTSEAVNLETGIFISNNGFAYDDTDLRHIHRVVGINIPIRVNAIMKNKIYIGAGHNFNFPFHYKHTTFTARSREDKSIVTKEYFSDRVSKFYPYMEISAGISFHGFGRFSIRLQTFYMNFFNAAYTQSVNNIDIMPYQNLIFEQNIRIIIAYNPAL